MKYEITDDNNNPLPVDKITVTDEDGNIIKQVTDTSEIDVTKTDGIETGKPYTVTVTFTETPENPTTPPQTTPFTVDKECYTVSPTLQPTLAPTITQDIPCGERSLEGSKSAGDTSTFTFTNGGEFTGMKFIIIDNTDPLIVTSIVITDPITGTELTAMNTDRIAMTEDDGLVNGREYIVTVTYGTNGTNVKIGRECFTEAPTKKPTQAPVASTLTPTKQPTIVNELECGDELTVPASATNPKDSHSIEFTIDQETSGMVYTITNEDGTPLTASKITITDEDGDIVKELTNINNIDVDKTFFNGRLVEGETYTITVEFPKTQETPFKIERECVSNAPTETPTTQPTISPTKTPTKSPTITQDVICGQSLREGTKNTGDTTTITFTNGGDFIGMKLTITDDDTPLTVTSIIITDTETGETISVTDSDSITFTKDDGLVDARLYSVTITYDLSGNDVRIKRTCLTSAPTKKPTQAPVTSTLTPTKYPTITPEAPLCGDNATIPASPENPQDTHTFTFTTPEDEDAMKYEVTDEDGNPLPVDKIRIIDENGIIIKEVHDTNEIEVDRTPENGGIETNKPYTVEIIFTETPENPATPPQTEPFTVGKECYTATPTLQPTKQPTTTPTTQPTLLPTITQDIPCGESSPEGAKTSDDTSTFTFTNGGEFTGMKFIITDSGYPLTVASIVITDTITGNQISKTNTDRIDITTEDDGLVDGRVYSVTVTYDTTGTNVAIARECYTETPTKKPTPSPVVSTLTPTLLPTAIQILECNDDLTVPASPTNAINEFTFDFTTDENTDAMKYTVTDGLDNPMSVTKITITDKDGNIIKEVTGTSEIEVDRTPTNGGLITNEPYTVTITTPTKTTPFKIAKECYTPAPTVQPTTTPSVSPTVQPTKSPTITQDIICGESSTEGAKNPGDTSTFTFTNGGGFIGMEFVITDNDSPINVTSIVITDIETGYQITELNTDSIKITTDDGLVDGRLYSVTITYQEAGSDIEIARNCFTEAPTKKPTQAPVTSTLTPTKYPTITPEPPLCDEDTTIPASPENPEDKHTFTFTTDEDTDGMKYEVTDENGNPLPVDKIRIIDENGFIVKEVQDASEIEVDRTPENGGIETNKPYIVEIIFTETPENPATPPQTTPFTVAKECYTAAPTLQPTLSPTIVQDISCEDSSIEGAKNSDETTVFTFTNGGEFVGMKFTITDNYTPLTVESITIINTETGETLKSLNDVDSISVTTADDNLENGPVYQVTIIYDAPGTAIEIERSCFTLAPTTKPTIAPTTSPVKEPTVSPSRLPTATPTKAPSISPTKIPTKSPTITQDIICDDELIINEATPIPSMTFTFTNSNPYVGMEYNVKQPNGNPLDVASIVITDSNGNELTTPATNTDSISVTTTDGLINGEEYTVTITFNTPIIRGEIERNCFTLAPTKTPTNAPTILQDIICNDESIIEDYRGLTTTEQLFIPGVGMKNIEIYISDGNNNGVIVDSIKITDINDGLIKEEIDTNAILFGESDGNFNPTQQYKLIIDYRDNTPKVVIDTICLTNAPTKAPTKTTTTKGATTTQAPTKSPTITSDIDCNDDLTVQASPSNSIDEFIFDFTGDEETIGMKYTITDDNGNPLTAEKITITDEDGNIVKEISDTSEIDVDKTPGNGALLANEPYKVTVIFTSNPSVIPAIMIPFTINRDCYTNAPTELPTLSPTIIQDIPCEESLIEGAKPTDSTTTFTFTNGGSFIGMEFSIKDNGNPLNVASIVITDDTGATTKSVTTTDSIIITTADDNLENGKVYTVTITYSSPGTAIEIERLCFTEAPTTKPTESPVTSTRRPTTSPTITNVLVCDDKLPIEASPTNPVDTTTFDFTTPDDEEGMKYEVTDENGNPITVDKITITDEDGNIICEKSAVSEIIVDRTPENCGIETDKPYTVSIELPQQTTPFNVGKECYTSEPTLQPTLSPTITQDIPCDETEPITGKTTGEVVVFTFTNGGEFDGMTFKITDNNGNPLPVTSIKITDSNGNTLKEILTSSDAITVTKEDDNLVNGEVYAVEITYGSGAESGSNIERDCFTSAPTSKPTKSPTIIPEIECDDTEGIQTDEPIESFTFKFDTDDVNEVGMEFTVKDENGNELPVDKLIIKDDSGIIVKTVDDVSKIEALISNEELSPNEDYTVEIIFENPITTFEIERNCFTLSPTKTPTTVPTSSPTIKQELDCGQNLHVLNENGVYMTEFEFQAETPFSSVIFSIVDKNNVALNTDSLVIQSLAGSNIKRVNNINMIEFSTDDVGFNNGEVYKFIVDYDDNNILDDVYILKRCFTEAPTTKPTVTPTLQPTLAPTLETKCVDGNYLSRTFDETASNGVGLYATTIENNFVVLKYKGNGDSFIRLCFSKDCQNTGASSYTNGFFEITIDEGGNTGKYSLKYIDTDGTITILDTITRAGLDLISSIEVDFYIAFDMLEDGIIFGNADQVGQNVLLSNDLQQCCVSYPTDVIGQRYTKPFRNIYYGSLGALPANNVEIKFCTEPIDLCPDFEIDYSNLVAYYRADNFMNDFDTSSEIESRAYIKDISNNGNNIEAQQVTNILNMAKATQTVAGEEFTSMNGDSSVVINIDSSLNSDSILPPLYTLFTVARRNPNSPNAGNEGAIFEAQGHDFTSGFGTTGEIGQAQREGVTLSDGTTSALALTDPITLAPITVASDSFIMSSDKRSGYRVNGIDTTKILPSLAGFYSDFGVNTNPTNGESSSFEISEIIIFKTELTVDEICCIEYYLAERNKIRSENGEALYTAETYPSCCIEVDEYPVYNPTDGDIITQSNPARSVTFLQELKEELFGDNKYGNNLYKILCFIGIFLNILLVLFVCLLVVLRNKNRNANKQKIISYDNTSSWNDNESGNESDMEYNDIH